MGKCLGIIVACLGVLGGGIAFGQTLTGTVMVHSSKPGHAIGAGFYGLMTEEINHAYDGGLCAELVRNRSFRDREGEAVSWSVSGGKMTWEGSSTPDIKVEGSGSQVEVSNNGFWGVPVMPNTTYDARIRAKADGSFKGPLTLAIASEGGTDVATASIPKLTSDWQVYEVRLKVGKVAASKQGKFVLRSSGAGTFWLNYVSLFPPTFHRRTNGLRSDLMELMGGMKPSFLRLPGGNYLEGDTIPTRFNWKETLGDPIGRPGHQGPWGYRSTDGLGLLEFLEWCEDLKMKPLLAVYAGYSLRQQHVDPGPKLAPFVQDALDEIEYLNGDVSTKWGAERARDGHPKPFDLEYVEVGNEDWFDRSRSYDGRFAQFYDAIKKRYPKLKLIATMPVQSRVPDVVDDHYYRSAAEMARDSGHYDNYSRKDPKIFVGEWASTEGTPTPTLQAALGDAAWLTGLERDSDVVVMEAYAPLLVNVNRGAFQWGTNLIGYDNMTSFGSPSYYVQSMFARYTGKQVVPSEVSVNLPSVATPAPHGAVGLATWLTDAEYKDMELTQDGRTERLTSDGALAGWRSVRGAWTLDSAEGAVRQTSNEENTLATFGEPNWTNYTYHLKARKLSGDEGFMIPFHVVDAENYWFWNVGGWNNRRTALQEKESGGNREASRVTRMTVETGRWYDIKIEVGDGHIRCYLDGKLVTEADEKPEAPVSPIYVAASRARNGKLFLKVVNFSNQDADLNLNFDGHVGKSFQGLELSGERGATNSIAEPTKVEPNRIRLMGSGTSLKHLFPARSVTVLTG